MPSKMYTYPLLIGALVLSAAVCADEPDATAQARAAAQTARVAAQTARASAEAAQAQAETARVDAQRELDRMREQMRDLSRKMADLSIKLGDVGPHTYAFRYLGDPDRGMIGVVLAPQKDGLHVDAVTPGGPADKAGVRDGDVLVAIDGRTLPGEDASDALHDLKVGQSVKLTIRHDGKSREIALKAERREPFDFADAFGKGNLLPPDFDRRVQIQVRDTMHHAHDGMRELRLLTPWWGLNLAPLNPDLGGYFGTDKGVLVLSADASAFKGLKSGDVVQDVSGRSVTRPEDALRLLRDAPAGSQVKVQVLRQRKPVVLSLKAPEFKGIFVPPPPPPAPPAPPAMPAPPAPAAAPAPRAMPAPPTPPVPPPPPGDDEML
ncbi:MAG: PDZ domain-containing protein [Xanthomonadaceae bacterium]|nr:PDZ domain-containing protein [Xanthomonadaceae bacterium]